MFGGRVIIVSPRVRNHIIFTPTCLQCLRRRPNTIFVLWICLFPYVPGTFLFGSYGNYGLFFLRLVLSASADMASCCFLIGSVASHARNVHVCFYG